MITLDYLLAEESLAVAETDTIEEVTGELVERLELLLTRARVVEIQPLETGLHLDLGDGESPDVETGEESIPVLVRDEIRRRVCRMISGVQEKGGGRTASTVVEAEEETGENHRTIRFLGVGGRREGALEHRRR